MIFFRGAADALQSIDRAEADFDIRRGDLLHDRYAVFVIGKLVVFGFCVGFDHLIRAELFDGFGEQVRETSVFGELGLLCRRIRLSLRDPRTPDNKGRANDGEEDQADIAEGVACAGVAPEDEEELVDDPEPDEDEERAKTALDRRVKNRSAREA